VEEHIDLGIKYDPSIGIFGMDFFCCMSRRGARVAYVVLYQMVHLSHIFDCHRNVCRGLVHVCFVVPAVHVSLKWCLLPFHHALDTSGLCLA
jgi:hypothetical protein